VTWIVVGAAAGLIAAICYAVLVFGSGPDQLGLVLAVAFALSLALAGFGLALFVSLPGGGTLPWIAAAATVIGSVVFVLMATVQLSVRSALPVALDPTGLAAAQELTDRVHFGLDVAWDVYFAAGMAIFGVVMVRHPRLGWLLGGSGAVIAAMLVVINVATFPVPPASAGSIDLGPLAGLWYLAVTIQVIRSLGWVRTQMGAGGQPEGH
jgi:hypothetical protein